MKVNEQSTKSKFRKGFKIGLALTLIFQAVTLLDFWAMVTGQFGMSNFAHRLWNFGFPFSMFSGWYATFPDEADFFGIFYNIIFAIIFSLFLGLVFKYTDVSKDFVSHRFFILGFLAGTILLIGLNFISYFLDFYLFCFDCTDIFGFPLLFGRHIGFPTQTEIFWYFLSLNIVIWFIFCLCSGFLTDLLARKRLMEKLK